MSLIQTTVLKDVLAERQRQDEKWGEQNHAHPVWMLILAEEVGESAKASLEIQVGDQADQFHLRSELIQVAAVAIAWVECIDRKAARQP